MSVLVVDKARGPTSFDVVRRVKGLLAELWGGKPDRATKVGHGGTLDPMASGVLPVCVGEATKLASLLLDADKTYEATLCFGVETDTLDAEGHVVAQHPTTGVSAAAVEEALAAFRGPQEQIPPMYSALKQGGRPLYEYARAGVDLPRASRPVVVHELDLTAFEGPDRCQVRVRCSKGTYVRVLAADLGRRLGCGAHLTALRRTASGPFLLADACTLPDLQARVRAGQGLPFLTLTQALADLPAVTADEATAVALVEGRKVPCGALAMSVEGPGRVAVLRSDGTLLAVAEPGPGDVVHTLRIFHRQTSDGRRDGTRDGRTEGPAENTQE